MCLVMQDTCCDGMCILGVGTLVIGTLYEELFFYGSTIGMVWCCIIWVF